MEPLERVLQIRLHSENHAHVCKVQGIKSENVGLSLFLLLHYTAAPQIMIATDKNNFLNSDSTSHFPGSFPHSFCSGFEMNFANTFWYKSLIFALKMSVHLRLPIYQLKGREEKEGNWWKRKDYPKVCESCCGIMSKLDSVR